MEKILPPAPIEKSNGHKHTFSKPERDAAKLTRTQIGRDLAYAQRLFLRVTDRTEHVPDEQIIEGFQRLINSGTIDLLCTMVAFAERLVGMGKCTHPLRQPQQPAPKKSSPIILPGD